MAEIVKNLSEAQEKGLISQPNASNNNGLEAIGKIISDVKVIMEKVSEMRGIKKNNEEPQLSEEKKMDLNDIKPKENKTPVAVLDIEEKEIDKLLNDDLNKLINNPNVDENITLKELIKNWGHLKELLKPEIKKFVQRTAKARIEYK